MIKIPLKYQVFDLPVEILSRDVERLSGCISCWNRLHEIFLLGGLNDADLRRLVILELMGAQRVKLLGRLLGRIAKRDRQRNQQRVERALT